MGNDLQNHWLFLPAVNFNPRSRVGNDVGQFSFSELLSYFNPRSRVGNDRILPRLRRIPTISIHVPAWGTTIGAVYIARTWKISIHVPAWGTTCSLSQPFVVDFISIHVPAWGTTYISLGLHCPSFHFNPRSRVGNDSCFPFFPDFCLISIHVPAWGTTTNRMNFQQYFIDFNPRSRVGNDDHGRGNWKGRIHFNPRSRVGNDGVLTLFFPCVLISIHVPAWGTTLALVTSTLSSLFQSTFPRGERRIALRVYGRVTVYFNPRSRVGNDRQRTLKN